MSEITRASKTPGETACWTKQCSCGETNYGCMMFNVMCWNCETFMFSHDTVAVPAPEVVAPIVVAPVEPAPVVVEPAPVVEPVSPVEPVLVPSEHTTAS